jgi:formyl-CoA transferase
VSWFAAADAVHEEGYRAEMAEARERGASFEEQRAIWERTFVPGGFANIYFRHYRTADGFISVGCLSPGLNARFRAVTGLVDPRQEPGFDLGSPEARPRLAKLVAEAEALFASRTSRDWLTALQAGGVPCGPFNFPPDVFHDEQILANEYLVEIDHPAIGPYITFAPPLRMDATPARVQGPPPLLDEHTDSVLADLGFDVEAIAALRRAGVAGAS